MGEIGIFFNTFYELFYRFARPQTSKLNYTGEIAKYIAFNFHENQSTVSAPRGNAPRFIALARINRKFDFFLFLTTTKSCCSRVVKRAIIKYKLNVLNEYSDRSLPVRPLSRIRRHGTLLNDTSRINNNLTIS